MRQYSEYRIFCSLCFFFFILSTFSLFTVNVSAFAIGADRNSLPRDEISVVERSPHVEKEPNKKLERTSILLKIGYDGSYFSGWSAANKSQRFVEGEIKKRLAKIFGNLSPECVIVEGCSRTDKGVHARGMVAQAYAITPAALEATRMGSCHYPDQPSIPGKRLPHPWNSTDTTECFVPITASINKIGFALNRMSTDDLRIFAVAASPASGDLPFHPTINARWKTYRYTISTGSLADPLRRKHVWHVGKVDECFLERMKDAASVLQGVHDFTAFSCTPSGPQDRKRRKENHNGVCHLCSIEIASTDYTWRDTQEYTIAVTGDRFLYKMVRVLVGALVLIAMEDGATSKLQDALQSGERPPNGFLCAPAHGLVLESVDFDTSIDWEPVNS